MCFAVVDRTGNVTVYEAVRLHCTAACGRYGSEEKNDVLMWIVVSFFIIRFKTVTRSPVTHRHRRAPCHRKCLHVHRLDGSVGVTLDGEGRVNVVMHKLY